MIARIFIPVLLMIVLSDWYLWRYWSQKVRWRRYVLPVFLLSGGAMLVYTVAMAMQKDFAPIDNRVLDVYLFLLGLIVIPKFLFVLCSAIGRGARRLRGGQRNWGDVAGLLLVLLNWYVLMYGSFVGFSKLTVRHVVYHSPYLPQAFDHYRIVQFSDAHVGTYGLRRAHLLSRAVDSIKAQHADMIVFTGDLQNMQPDELRPHEAALASLKAPDGVFSILGNHDYAQYINADEATKAANCQRMVDAQRRMGWALLLNEHRTIYRGGDSIVVAGMENDGDGKRFPARGDVEAALKGVSDSSFVLMLEHDPKAWRRKILPQSNAQLTLSGHTHAMQFELFGWSPASLIYKEWGGLFHATDGKTGDRAINVSTGLGGFIPFRFGVPGEIVVIELRSMPADSGQMDGGQENNQPLKE